MKFHGITMVGPFVNQKLTSTPTFDPARDQGRLVWLTDGTLWYGSDTEWVNFAGGAGDANEVEDMYSDLLRTTIFLNASYDEFADTGLIESTNMTHDQKNKWFTYTTGQTIESVNLFDSESGITWVDYVLPSVDYIDTISPQIQITSDGGVTWSVAENNKIFRIPNTVAAHDVRLRLTGGGTGTLFSWGILYNKDMDASCSKYGLTYTNFTAEDNQTVFILSYQPGAIQVYLNGDLLDDSDYIADNGTDITFPIPMEIGDIVYVVSFSTSILNPNIDLADFIKHDGTIPFTDNQSMGLNRIIDLADAVDSGDAVNYGQYSTLDIAIGNNTTSIGNNTTSIGNNTTDISTNTSDILSFQNLYVKNTVNALVTGGIHGGDLVYTSANTVHVIPFSCISDDPTPAQIYNNTTITVPVTVAVNQHRSIWAVKLNTGVMTVLSSAQEDGSDLPATVDHKRWLGFVSCDSGANIKHFLQSGDYYQFSVASLGHMAIITNIWATVDHTPFIPTSRINTVEYGCRSWSINLGIVARLYNVVNGIVASARVDNDPNNTLHNDLYYNAWGEGKQDEFIYDSGREFRQDSVVPADQGETTNLLLRKVTLKR